MPAATPALETVITAVVSSVGSVSGVTDVLGFDHPFDDDVEFLKASYLSGVGVSSFDVFTVDVLSVTPVEGPAPGEDYSIYNLRVQQWSFRVGVEEWSQDARGVWRKVLDELSKNQDIFAVSNQPQLRTPETVRVQHGSETVTSAFWRKPQKIFKPALFLDVEARRWGS